MVPLIHHLPVFLSIILLATSCAAKACYVSPVLATRAGKECKKSKDGGIVALDRTRWGHPGMQMAKSSNEKGNDVSSFLLEEEYDLTEQKITERGEIEERLMASSTRGLLLANEPAAAAAAAAAATIVTKEQRRGFGGGGFSTPTKAKKGKKKRKVSKPDKSGLKEHQLTRSQEAEDHVKVLKREGLVKIDGILSDSVADALRMFVYDIRTIEANRAIQATTMQDKFPTIHRWDVSLPLFEYNTKKGEIPSATTIVHRALQHTLQDTAVGETMRRFLGTDTAELYELASYISDPGSSRQVVHSDTPCFGTDDQQPILCTCFVALQDVRMDMGPTLWLPRTNTYAMHDRFFGEEDAANDGEPKNGTPLKDEFLRTQASVVGILPKGSCVLFDSRLLHCGTANESANDSRALLFFSFKHPSINLFNPGGDMASIRSDLKGRFRLSNFL